jgi:hypothetical protein
MGYTRVDYVIKSRKKTAPRDNFNPKELSLGFKKTYDLIEEYWKRKDYLSCYVLSFSVLEDRLNSCYKVCLWYEKSKVFSEEKVPTFEEVYLEGTSEKLSKLKDHLFLTETTFRQLSKVIAGRNSRFHSTMWVMEQFDKNAVSDVLLLTRELDKIRRKQKKTMGK